MIEGNPDDSMSFASEATTEVITNDKEARQDYENLKKKFDLLLSKYQETCQQHDIPDDFSKTLTDDNINSATSKPAEKYNLFENSSAHPFQSHNENVLQGYQR